MRWPLGLVVPLQEKTTFSPFSPVAWKSALRFVSQAGYDGVELAVGDPKFIDAGGLIAEIDAAHLRVFAIATGQAALKEGLSLSSSSEKVREKAIQRIKDFVAFAKFFDALVIIGTIHGGQGKKHYLVEALRECTGFDPSIRLVLEPLNRYESIVVNTVHEALSIIEKVGAENLGVSFDTFHANIEEANFRKALLTVGDRLWHVEIADSNRWVPGHGHIPFREIWDTLEEIGYKGHIVCECFAKPTVRALLSVPTRFFERAG